MASGGRLAGQVKRAIQSTLTRRGYELRRLEADSTHPVPSSSVLPAIADQMNAYFERAQLIDDRRQRQTVETVAMLRRKYEAPVLGDVRVWELVELLAQCVDPSDGRLFGASQQFHVLQMLESMERDGLTDPDFLLAALVHDIGKVLLLFDEDPANVVCMTRPIATAEARVGLDHATLQWNHDEFAFTRLVDHVPEHIAWLVRYHSILLPECEPLMDDRDRDYLHRYLQPFGYYDHETKTPFELPSRRIQDYRDLVEEAFPKPIRF
jgi:hypothetical protein